MPVPVCPGAALPCITVASAHFFPLTSAGLATIAAPVPDVQPQHAMAVVVFSVDNFVNSIKMSL
jgi:hypothetical protein